jgi:carnitine O-acetyltransferase
LPNHLTVDGFFDAGMLLQALKANNEKEQKPHQVAEQRRRAVGKKLALSDY